MASSSSSCPSPTAEALLPRSLASKLDSELLAPGASLAGAGFAVAAGSFWGPWRGAGGWGAAASLARMASEKLSADRAWLWGCICEDACAGPGFSSISGGLGGGLGDISEGEEEGRPWCYNACLIMQDSSSCQERACTAI